MTDDSAAADDLSRRMRALAQAFAAEHHGLDYSLASLAALEKAVSATRAARDGERLARATAYLGETLLRAAPPSALAWVAGGEGEGPALRAAGGATWFPATKIAKFLANGAPDSPAAFAHVVLATLPAPEQAAREIPAAGAQAVREFFAEPSAEALLRLCGARGVLYEEELHQLLRECSARPSPFYSFFAIEPHGKGRQLVNVGYLAAQQAWLVISLGLGDFATERPVLSAMLESGNPCVRANAAWLLAVWHFQCGVAADGLAQFEAGDAGVRVATLEGLLRVVYDARSPTASAEAIPLRPISRARAAAVHRRAGVAERALARARGDGLPREDLRGAPRAGVHRPHPAARRAPRHGRRGEACRD